MPELEEGSPQPIDRAVSVPIAYAGTGGRQESATSAVDEFAMGVEEVANIKSATSHAETMKATDESNWALYQQLRGEKKMAEAMLELDVEIANSEAGREKMLQTLEDRGLKLEELPPELQAKFAGEEQHLKTLSEINSPAEALEDGQPDRETDAANLGQTKESAQTLITEISQELSGLERDPHIQTQLAEEQQRHDEAEKEALAEEAKQLNSTASWCESYWYNGKPKPRAVDFIRGMTTSAVIGEAYLLTAQRYGKSFSELPTADRIKVLKGVEGAYRDLPGNLPSARLSPDQKAVFDYYREMPGGEKDYLRYHGGPGSKGFDKERWERGKYFNDKDQAFHETFKRSQAIEAVLDRRAGYGFEQKFPGFNHIGEDINDENAAKSFARAFSSFFSMANFAAKIDADHIDAKHLMDLSYVFSGSHSQDLSGLSRVMGKLGFIESDGVFIESNIPEGEAATFKEQLEPWRALAIETDRHQREARQSYVEEEKREIAKMLPLLPDSEQIEKNLETAKSNLKKLEGEVSTLTTQEGYKKEMHERAGFFEKRKINAELEEIRKNLSKAQSNANALRHSLESLSARSEGLTKLVIARRQRVGTPAKESEEDLRRRLGELEKIHYL